MKAPSAKTFLKGVMLVPFVYLIGDFYLVWLHSEGKKAIYSYFNSRDIFFVGLLVLPAMVSHLVTIWGHYYRADSHFQKSIVQVVSRTEDDLKNGESKSSTKEKKKNTTSIWERHDSWKGWTVKVWVLVAICVFLNFIWFIQPVIAFLPRGIRFLGVYAGFMAYVAYASGYAAMASCAMLLLFVLRRSMFQAMGYTYADLLPLHRGLGLAFTFWSTIHMVCYILYYVHFDAFRSRFNFDGTTRGPQNMLALVGYAALIGLYLTSLPAIRRKSFGLFLHAHRALTIVMFLGTLLHFPYYLIWYYVLPSICLYLADRFVPKWIQTLSVAPKVTCSFQQDADILTIQIHSRDRMQPLKPYYPGDYVNVEIPQLSHRLQVATIYHPFTIASYWPEDPYSMTIYVRTFQENPASWTGGLAKLCLEQQDKENVTESPLTRREPIAIKANIDGIFGDRDHDYLSSKTLVIFSAGAAITTFMSLLKAIAAQIEATPFKGETIQVHLICTFRYESELYAYGDFMERITHDPRFLSWLQTRIYVSRPDKDTPPSACPTGQCTSEFVCGGTQSPKMTKIPKVLSEIEVEIEVPQESTSLLGNKQRRGKARAQYGSLLAQKESTSSSSSSSSSSSACCGDKSLCCQGSAQCDPALTRVASSSSSTIQATIVEDTTFLQTAYPPETLQSHRGLSGKGDDALHYYSSLPTFLAASSTKSSTLHAKKDLVATTSILIIPLVSFLWIRTVALEGTYNGETRWCRTTRDKNQHTTNHCLWAYALVPGIVHILVAIILGYTGLWIAKRRANRLFPWSADLASSLFTGEDSTASMSVANDSHALPKGGVVSNASVGGAEARDASYQRLIQGLGLPSPLPSVSSSPSGSSSSSSTLTPSTPRTSTSFHLPPSSSSLPLPSVHFPIRRRKILFERGRLQVNQHIQELQALGVGCEPVTSTSTLSSSSSSSSSSSTPLLQPEEGAAETTEAETEESRSSVLVFGAGPDAFVDMIQESCQKLKWDVEFHKETWAP